MSRPRYFLPPDVHFCCRGEAVVFLDLKADDYILVTGRQAQVLRARSRDANVESDDDCLRELAAAKLLTTDPRHGRSVLATRVARATQSLIEDDIQSARNAARYLPSFVAACLAAAAQLQFRRLASTAKTVARRRSRSSATDVDFARARELTSVFHQLRFLFPRPYLCLYDSLSLLDFLARYGLFPAWVFAIKLEPWAAHCWVQHGDYIFNERVEEAAGYTPVMVV